MRPEKNKESFLHRVQEFTLQDIKLAEEYAVERELGEGCFAKILLATHRASKTTVVLKAIHAELTSSKDFFREFHYSYNLSPHPNIVSSYPVAFTASDCFVFAEEYAPFGDLAGAVKAGGVPEDACKKIAQQLSSALDFMHSKQLVHRDIKLENILIFSADLSRIKLCDFGETRREGMLVNKVRCTWHQFLPPEVCEVVQNERFVCRTATDVWQTGVVLFVCLTGCPPWQSAELPVDANYSNFVNWQKRKSTKIPNQFKRFSPRLLRLFRRIFEHKPEKRAAVTEVMKYMKDSWFLEKSSNCSPVERKHSVMIHNKDDVDDVNWDESKVKLKKLLSSYGLETTIDQKVVTSRIWEWVLSCENNFDNTSEGV